MLNAEFSNYFWTSLLTFPAIQEQDSTWHNNALIHLPPLQQLLPTLNLWAGVKIVYRPLKLPRCSSPNEFVVELSSLSLHVLAEEIDKQGILLHLESDRICLWYWSLNENVFNRAGICSWPLAIFRPIFPIWPSKSNLLDQIYCTFLIGKHW